MGLEKANVIPLSQVPEAINKLILNHKEKISNEAGQDLAKAIYEDCKVTFEQNIDSNIAPPLQEATIQRKIKMNSSTPEIALSNTGNFKKSLQMTFEQTSTGFKMVLHCASDIIFLWFAGGRRAKGMPQRIPLTGQHIRDAVAFRLKEMRTKLQERRKS